VEKWIHAVKKEFLDVAPIKCVGLNYEFTNPREGRHNQRAAVLQFPVASEILVFQICRANEVPHLLKEFLQDDTIRFCGVAIDNDVRMLRYYRIEIPSVFDLQKIIPKPPTIPFRVSMICPMLLLGQILRRRRGRRRTRRTTRRRTTRTKKKS
jgi:hypothetical protein